MNTLPSPALLIHATPYWVFGLFLLLLWTGLRQMSASRPHVFRATLLPLCMAGLSLYGAFGTLGQSPAALAAWAFAAAVALMLLLRLPLPPGVAYQAAVRRFEIPGSAMPLVLMMGVFATRFAVAAATAMHPELLRITGVAVATGLVYGAFCGVFAGRGLRLLSLARRGHSAALAA